MAISKDLFLSILSMDAYNRGYGAGIADTQGDLDGLGESALLGDARILARSSEIDVAVWQDAGFYALAYAIEAGEEIEGLAAGQTVISYRGTDNMDIAGLGEGASDVWQGWITGAGVPGSQSWLALDFFESVTGDNALLRESGDVILTGHSLGGGLAGAVAAKR